MCKYSKIIVIGSLLAALQAQAQQSSVGTFSPYTFYGIGQLESSMTTAQRAMGGVGVADYSAVEINPRNVASYARVARNTMLMDMGVCWGNFYQKSGNFRKTNNTLNLANVSFVAPLMKGWGVGFDLEPRSSVGYRVRFADEIRASDGVAESGSRGIKEKSVAQQGEMVYDYQGGGGVTRWSLGVGCQVTEWLTVGVEILLHNCNITGSCQAYGCSFEGDTLGQKLDVERDYSYAKVLSGVSVQWRVFEKENKRLVLGLRFVPEANCRFETQEIVVSGVDTVSNVTRNSRLKLPSSWSVGAVWRSRKWAVAADWELQRWSRSFDDERAVSGRISWADNCVLALGGEFVPNPGDVRNFWNRVTYRVGVRYNGCYVVDLGRRLKTRVVSVGVKLPMKQSSSINVAAEYGRNGYDAEGLIKTDFWSLSVGFAFYGADGWFKKYKYK